MAKYYSSKTDNNAIAYVNGKVFTINQNRPWATGFVVSWDGIFEAVGDDAEIMAIADSRRLATYNLRGRFVMPGIHDAHTHLLMAGEGKVWQTNIGWESTEETIASDLKRNMCNCQYAHIVGDWVVGNFYLPNLFPEGKPDRKYLDDVFPTTPVLIREMSGHKVLVNSEALRQMKIDVYTSQPPAGGVFVRRPDGAMTGELFETATGAAWTKLPIPPLAIVKESIRRSIKTCHRYGITSIQEASANTLYLHALRELEEENRLDLDVHPHIVCGNEFFSCETKQSLEALLDVAEAFRSKHVDSRFVKFWLDGSPIEPGSTHCRLDDHGVPDKRFLFFDNETLLEAVKRYDARGFTCKMHAAGEGSVRQALDIYQAVREGNANGPRHEIAHSNAIHPDDFSRLASLRITAEMSPSVFHIADTFEQIGHTLRYEFDLVHLAGARTTIGTDYPITKTPNLLPPVAGLVGKVTVDPRVAKNPIVPEIHQGKTAEEISGPILCYLLTLGAAEAIGKEKTTGSIEVGKKANFVAFSHDLSRGEFKDAEVLQTWFEGRVVFSREALEEEARSL
ncbi:hypothetical protein RBB50_007081 [Rhinocladiella similis]